MPGTPGRPGRCNVWARCSTLLPFWDLQVYNSCPSCHVCCTAQASLRLAANPAMSLGQWQSRKASQAASHPGNWTALERLLAQERCTKGQLQHHHHHHHHQRQLQQQQQELKLQERCKQQQQKQQWQQQQQQHPKPMLERDTTQGAGALPLDVFEGARGLDSDQHWLDSDQPRLDTDQQRDKQRLLPASSVPRPSQPRQQSRCCKVQQSCDSGARGCRSHEGRADVLGASQAQHCVRGRAGKLMLQLKQPMTQLLQRQPGGSAGVEIATHRLCDSRCERNCSSSSSESKEGITLTGRRGRGKSHADQATCLVRSCADAGMTRALEG